MPRRKLITLGEAVALTGADRSTLTRAVVAGGIIGKKSKERTSTGVRYIWRVDPSSAKAFASAQEPKQERKPKPQREAEPDIRIFVANVLLRALSDVLRGGVS